MLDRPHANRKAHEGDGQPRTPRGPRPINITSRRRRWRHSSLDKRAEAHGGPVGFVELRSEGSHMIAQPHAFGLRRRAKRPVLAAATCALPLARPKDPVATPCRRPYKRRYKPPRATAG